MLKGSNLRTMDVVLELIIELIRRYREAQEELTEEQADALNERLIKGELNQAQALALLTQRARAGDLRTIGSTLEYFAALGMDGPEVLEIAATTYFEHRHYAEAQRYSQTLCYEHDRYGPALRRLGILDALQGDYIGALVHIEEYVEHHGLDPVLAWYQLDALVRSGALHTAQTLNQELGIDPDLERFLENRAAGRGFRRFSWHGTPTRNGELLEGVDVHRMQRFMSDVIRRPLVRKVPDLAALDTAINEGMYVEDARQFGLPEVWIHPASFELTMAGDCEDFALWAWVNLCRMGYPARFVIGGRYDEGPNHAWVTIHRGRSIQVLECTPQGYNPLIKAHSAVEYRPWWSMDRQLHCYRH